jgi:hypothetical protein
MKKEINHLVDHSLESVKHLNRAHASPFIYGKVMEQLKAIPEPSLVSGAMVLRWAALLLVLGMLNAVTLRKIASFTKQTVSVQRGVNAIAEEYFEFQQEDSYNY